METREKEGVALFKGEHTNANPPSPLAKSRSRKHKDVSVDITGPLYDFLITSAEQNERTLSQEIRFWLKKAIGLKVSP